MKEEKPQLYEGMYILSAQLTEDAKAKAFEKIKAGIVQRGGEIRKVHEQGKRRLAYIIGNHREGNYFLIYFDAKPSAIPELWEEYRLNENLVRFMTTKTDEVLDELKFKQLPEL
ncbi:MAG: rpsF [Chlamydiia bacterium]|nr:rpsF [Chlamydiia bacterium]